MTDERKMKKKKEENENRWRAGGTACKRNNIERGNERRMAFVCAKKGGNRWKNRRNGS